mgnify:CR=1 FL=1|tara:strand:- start:72 stop:458 length:387 start_codon:yes stop_codon:yes gene_type:complete
MGKGDYLVGYKKPPKATQFKPGLSGNPKGRPKGTKNLKTDLEEELKEKITVTEAGQPKKLSKQRALLKAVVAKALKGDTKAISIVVGMVDKYLNDPVAEETDAMDDLADAVIVEAFKEKVLKEANHGK